MTLRTLNYRNYGIFLIMGLNYGNYGMFLIMGNAGFCPSAVGRSSFTGFPDALPPKRCCTSFQAPAFGPHRFRILGFRV